MSTVAKRLGIVGGCFDPVHYGHLAIAEEARECFKLERVIFVPAGRPPHKGGGTTAAASDRIAMVRLAISGNPHFAASDIELRRERPSFTIDTLEEMSRMEPGVKLYFIVGEDSLKELHTWHRAAELVERFDFIILGRPGVDEPSKAGLEERFGREAAEKLDAGFLRRELFNVSATEIRERVRTGRSIRYLVPEAVERYIMRKGLYR